MICAPFFTKATLGSFAFRQPSEPNATTAKIRPSNHLERIQVAQAFLPPPLCGGAGYVARQCSVTSRTFSATGRRPIYASSKRVDAVSHGNGY